MVRTGRLAVRSAENNRRKVEAQCCNEREESEVLTSVTFRSIDMVPHYLVEYRGAQKATTLSLNQALQVLHINVIMYVGFINNRIVRRLLCRQIGLIDDGCIDLNKNWGIPKRGSTARATWVPTHVRFRLDGIFFARDRRTDAKNEWHNDFLLWDLARVDEPLWRASVECFAIADRDPGSALTELHSRLRWLDRLVDCCTKNIGKSYSVEEGVGARSTSLLNGPPSGFVMPRRTMKYFDPNGGCLLSAACALIHYGGDSVGAEKLFKCGGYFLNIAALQSILQGVAKIGWTSDRVPEVHGKSDGDVLQFLLNHKGKDRLFLARLSVHDGVVRHVVGIDTGRGTIRDSCESFGVNLTKPNLAYCCGVGGPIRGIDEIRVLTKQLGKKRSARGLGNSNKKRNRKCFK